MNLTEFGSFIRTRRRELGISQQALADMLGLSAKAVSKWECGKGFPDVDNLPLLARALEVDIKALLAADAEDAQAVSENLRNLQFYICPVCGRFHMAMKGAQITCCRLILKAAAAQKADDAHAVSITENDGDWYLESEHPMEKGHYLSFGAFLNTDTCIFKKCYPQWDFRVRIPKIGHGIFLWYCTEHGLFYAVK